MPWEQNHSPRSSSLDQIADEKLPHEQGGKKFVPGSLQTVAEPGDRGRYPIPMTGSGAVAGRRRCRLSLPLPNAPHRPGRPEREGTPRCPGGANDGPRCVHGVPIADDATEVKGKPPCGRSLCDP